MPKDNSIKKVLIIGSGPIVIGQAAEFDYSGTQACKTFKEEGVEVVLVNSNPATIMTDRDMADKVYIEPLTVKFLEKIIAKERPDSLIAGMGGQTALNLSVELHDKGILDKYKVRVIGTSIASIKEGEDRNLFKKMMERIDQPVVESDIVSTVQDGLKLAERIGYPLVARPAYTLGGTGGGFAENPEDLEEILATGIHLSPVGQILIEKSVKGWNEVEYEVMRDSYGKSIVVCNMENVDPVGVHTGDSIVVAPSQTLSDEQVQTLRKASLDIIEELDIKGGCNVQFALEPGTLNYIVIEINPRVSRSSALASKATGYPIAKVSSKIALGYGLDEIENEITGKTTAAYEPKLDYLVVKIPKWPFDKFSDAKRNLGTKMMATGEIMAIGNSFEQGLLKGIRSLEIGRYSLINESSSKKTIEELEESVQIPNDERIFEVAELIRRDYGIEKVHEITKIDIFFLEKIKWIVDQEEELKKTKLEDLSVDWLRELKKKGFSDKGMADIMKCSPMDIYSLRKENDIMPVYRVVDTCAGEFEAISPYYYSTYEGENKAKRSDKKKVIVLGSGPIRIGQGIEFDYCSVHGVLALKKMGIETIIINNNPETVSTDYDIADKLYFEPLTEEDVLNVIELEKPDGIILQFGGQTAIKLAGFLNELDMPILGTKPEQIDAAEDREKFDALMEELEMLRPKGKAVWSVEEGLRVGEDLRYPVLVRPSYVLGGQGMEITHDDKELEKYLEGAFHKDKKNPVLIDKYLMGREIEVDAICDGEDILIPGIMEHLERAGVHSGDSVSIYPSINISEKLKEKIFEETKRVALALKVDGIINIQFIEYEDELYIIEVNPRSSRTVPYISKVTNVPLIELATRVMLGEKLKDMPYGTGIYKEPEIYSVKVPVFSTQKLPNVEMSLGPEMKSTGEVLGTAYTVEEALAKGFLGAGIVMPKENRAILATVNNHDKEEFLPLAKRFSKLGYRFIATKGTAKLLGDAGIEVEEVRKISEEKPNILDIIAKGELDLVINTPTKGHDSNREGFKIRRKAIENGIQVFTSLDTVNAMLIILETGLDLGEVEVINLGGGSYV